MSVMHRNFNHNFFVQQRAERMVRAHMAALFLSHEPGCLQSNDSNEANFALACIGYPGKRSLSRSHSILSQN